MNTAINWQLQLQERRARLLRYLLLAAGWGGIVGLVAFYFSFPAEMGMVARSIELVPFFTVWCMVVVAWLGRGLGYQVRAGIALAVVFLLSLYTMRRGGLAGMGPLWLVLVPGLSFILGRTAVGLWGGGLAVLAYVVFAILFSQGFIEPLVVEDPSLLAAWVSEGVSFLLVLLVLSVLLWAFSRDWQVVLVDISASNRQLQQQTARLQAATRVARAGSSTLDPVKLRTELVDTLYDEFSPLGVYFVGLYLLPAGETVATLRVAAGDKEREPLTVGEKVTVAEDSTVGWSLSRQEPYLVVGEEYSQLALPLLSRERLLGALIIYGEQSAALDEGSQGVFQTLADQVAMAIDNARLFTRTEVALEEVRAVHRHYLITEWQKYLIRNPVIRFNYLRPGERGVVEEQLRAARQLASSQGQIVRTQSATGESATEDILVAPLKLRGQVIGTIALHEPTRRSWLDKELAVVENVTEQTALAIENLRLMDVTQQRAVREHLVQDITTQMQRATDLESLMRIASQELLDALGSSQVHVELNVASEHGVGAGERGNV